MLHVDRIRRRRQRGVLVLSVVLALVGSTLAASPAFATHQGTAGSGRLYTPNWSVCNAGASAGVSGTNWAIGQINPTDVNASVVGCPGSWNVSVNSVSYPETWYGATSCFTAVQNGVCGSGKGVKLNTRTLTTTQQWQKTALHELGHVAGLGHRTVDTSVMASGASPPVSQYLDQHDRDSINASY
ncbi:matrixin family metalloprotease [Marisediminicola antarctica]|uniref:matrixin family metalloprotease n=1 Tax=Marisediminicola antarctica TaxID=674079 RepID=UPI00137AB6E7|nr:matrixin family metalloprotease [Marisediminicola antarctica]